MQEPDWLGPVALVALIGVVAIGSWMMVRAAVRHGERVAEQLGLRPEPAGRGYVGCVDGVVLRLLPNAWRTGEPDPVSPPVIEASSTGTLMMVATWPRPSRLPFYLESVPGGGRPHLPHRIRSGDQELDRICSILACDASAVARLLTDTQVRAALLALHAKTCCLFEIDAHLVSIHSAHHHRAVELAHDAAALALLLARTAEKLEKGEVS